MWYQPSGDGGRGLSPPMMLVKRNVGVAGTMREKACEMRVVRARRKESVVGDMVVI